MTRELEKEHYWEHIPCFRTILAHVFGFPHKAPKKLLEPHSTMRFSETGVRLFCWSHVLWDRISVSEFGILLLRLLLPGLIPFYRDQLSPKILQSSELHILQNDQLWGDLFQRMHLHHGLPSLHTYQQWSSGQSVQHQSEGQITKCIHKTQ